MTTASPPLTVRYGVEVSRYGSFSCFRIIRESAQTYFGHSDGWGDGKWSSRESRIDKNKIQALFTQEEEMNAAIERAKEADKHLSADERCARTSLSDAIKKRRETLNSILRGEQS